MASELKQMIDVVAKDKGIDPSIVIGAIEDAYVAAARARCSRATRIFAAASTRDGQVELYAVRSIVAEVTNPPA